MSRLLLFVLLLAGQACVKKSSDAQSIVSQGDSIIPEPPDRIIIKAILYNIAIIEVDSVEYLCNSNGGIIPLSRNKKPQ